MKTSIALALTTALMVGAASGYAAEDKKAPAAKASQMQPGGMGMMDEKQMAQMQEQMDRIRKTKDPKERQKLMDEHMRSMNEEMTMMRGMGGGMMMGMMGGKPGSMGPGMMGGGQGMDPKQRQDMMEKRMDMMQMMMEQMMQHQQMMQPAPAK